MQKSEIAGAKLEISKAKREIALQNCKIEKKYIFTVTAYSSKRHLGQTKWRTKARHHLKKVNNAVLIKRLQNNAKYKWQSKFSATKKYERPEINTKAIRTECKRKN